MLNVVEAIRGFNAQREPERLALKYARMRLDPFVFYRGTCHLYYQRLASVEMPPGAPLGWICGDLHLENYGSYKGDNGLVYFDINDFDEAVLAPVTWDLVRLVASLLVASSALRLPRPSADVFARALVNAYARALEAGKARWVERQTARGLIRQLLGGLRERRHAALLDRRTELRRKRRRLRCDGKSALPANRKQRARAEALLEASGVAQAQRRYYEVLDVARRVAGTGSLGVERYIVLVRGTGSPNGNVLLDLKQVLPSALAERVTTAQPAWRSTAHRVVALQNRMQAASPALLEAIARRRGAFVLRQLQPTEDRVSLDASRVKFGAIARVLDDMGQMLAWAHLRASGRQGAASADALIAFGADRKAWRADLLAAARRSAELNEQDWKAYAAAFDAGAFAQP